jgi:16S rRNA (guanine527-N7)-methyltransferase
VTEDGPAALAGVIDVSRETLSKLELYGDLIRRWNVVENLVSPDDLPLLWRRHIADSAQLPPLVPSARRWVDIGSGAGFPGMVIALTAPPGTAVALIESNRRKCAFLRQAIRQTGAPAIVHQGRAEVVLADWAAPVDCITARAVAPLDHLLALAEPVLLTGTPALFQKGRGFQREMEEAVLAFDFDLIQHRSRIDPDGVILEVRNVHRKEASVTKR